MTRAELQADIEQRVAQAQKLVGDPTKEAEFKSATEAIEKMALTARAMDKAEADAAELRAAMARAPAPAPEISDTAGWDGVRKQILDAIDKRGGKINLAGIERRALVSGGAGNNTVPGIIRNMVDGGKLRSRVSLFLGPNSITTIPVMSPTLALPVGSVPGATGTASDSTAALSGDALTLKPWYSTVQVSMGALMSTDIASELPSAMSDAFGGAIDKMIVAGTGSGSDGLGVFVASASGVPTSSDIVMASGTVASGPLWADYVGMVLELLALGGDASTLSVVVNPSVFKLALAQASAGVDPMKVEFLTRGTILGVPVIFSSYAQAALTNDYYVAVGGYFKHYALAIAQEITIDQIKTVGSDNVTFQAFMYMQGKPLIGGSFRRLQTTT